MQAGFTLDRVAVYANGLLLHGIFVKQDWELL